MFIELRAVGWHGPIFSPGWSGWHGPKISPQARAWAECQARGPCWHGPQTRRAVPAREVAGRAWPGPGPGRAGPARWPYIDCCNNNLLRATIFQYCIELLMYKTRHLFESRWGCGQSSRALCPVSFITILFRNQIFHEIWLARTFLVIMMKSDGFFLQLQACSF